MTKMVYYLWMSLRGKKSSSRYFITIFTIGLFIFFSTQMLSAWILDLTEETIQSDIETNRTIRWQFEESVQSQLVTKSQVKNSLNELKIHPKIEQVLFDDENLNSAVIMVKDYKDLLTMASFIETNYFGGTAINANYFTHIDMIKGVCFSTNLIKRLTQIISMLTYATLVSKYLDKRRNEIHRLWVVGCTDIRNLLLLFICTIVFFVIAYVVNIVLCVLTVSIIIFFFQSNTQTMYMIIQISIRLFFALTPFMLIFLPINAWVAFYKGSRIVKQF